MFAQSVYSIEIDKMSKVKQGQKMIYIMQNVLFKLQFVFLQTFPLQGWTLFVESMVCSLYSQHRNVGCRWSLSCRLLSVTCPHLQWHSPCLVGKVVSCTKYIHSKCKTKYY